jgi:hypothetical protein
MSEKYLVVAGGDGFQSVLCDSLEEARFQFVEFHAPSDGEEEKILQAQFDDEENWSWYIAGPGSFKERLRLDYECDWIEVTRITETRSEYVACMTERLEQARGRAQA